MEDHTAKTESPGTSVSMESMKYDYSTSNIGPAHVLQNFPVVINKILKSLPAKTLNTCARVCRTWNYWCKIIKRSRKELSWMFVECEEDENEEILVSQIKTFIENLSSQPNQLLLFCTTNLYEKPLKVPSRHGTRHPRAAKCEVMDVGDLMKKILPKDCKLLAMSADGIVGTESKTNKPVEVESRYGLSCLCLPQVEGLEVYSFNVDIYTYANRMDESSSGLFDIKQVTTVPEGKEVKAILFFCDEPFCPPEIGYTLLQHYKNTVVAGGYVDNLISPEECSHDPTGQSLASLMCVTFCGPCLHAVSVVIREEIKTIEEVEKAMRKLKDCNLPEEKSFAFMFACVGRGHSHYGKDNVEADIFRKYFPKTPLLGFFGNGEVGFNFLQKYDKMSAPSSSEAHSSSSSSQSASSSSSPSSSSRSSTNSARTDPKVTNKVRPLPKLYHAYTTIICLMSIS